MVVPDCIEKCIILRAPLARVWRAISDSREFGKWFGMAIDGPFVAGERIVGRIRPTVADPEVAKMQEPHSGKSFELAIERIEPTRSFAFRWHPFAVDPNVDYSQEPGTLVTFELSEVPEGTQLRITESGFDQIPENRRSQAFNANEGGWEMQTMLIEKYLVAYGDR